MVQIVKRFTKPLFFLIGGGLVAMAGILFILSFRREAVRIVASPISANETLSEPVSDQVDRLSTALQPRVRSQSMSQESAAAVLPEAPASTTYTNQTSGENNPTGVQSGFVPLIDSPVAERWQREEGITREDIEMAQHRLRKGGFPENMVNDPSMVRQFLPRRNINAVNVNGLTIAAKARAGEPIPFTLDGAYPDPSFEFTRFVITRENNLIRIRPIGNSSGDAVPGLEVPVTLQGEIDPLPPGTYHIEFPERGPVGSYELIVE